VVWRFFSFAGSGGAEKVKLAIIWMDDCELRRKTPPPCPEKIGNSEKSFSGGPSGRRKYAKEIPEGNTRNIEGGWLGAERPLFPLFAPVQKKPDEKRFLQEQTEGVDGEVFQSGHRQDI